MSTQDATGQRPQLRVIASPKPSGPSGADIDRRVRRILDENLHAIPFADPTREVLDKLAAVVAARPIAAASEPGEVEGAALLLDVFTAATTPTDRHDDRIAWWHRIVKLSPLPVADLESLARGQRHERERQEWADQRERWRRTPTEERAALVLDALRDGPRTIREIYQHAADARPNCLMYERDVRTLIYKLHKQGTLERTPETYAKTKTRYRYYPAERARV